MPAFTLGVCPRYENHWSSQPPFQTLPPSQPTPLPSFPRKARPPLQQTEPLSHTARQAPSYLSSNSLPLSSVRRKDAPLFVQIQTLSVFIAPSPPCSAKTCSIRHLAFSIKSLTFPPSFSWLTLFSLSTCLSISYLKKEKDKKGTRKILVFASSLSNHLFSLLWPSKSLVKIIYNFF